MLLHVCDIDVKLAICLAVADVKTRAGPQNLKGSHTARHPVDDAMVAGERLPSSSCRAHIGAQLHRPM